MRRRLAAFTLVAATTVVALAEAQARDAAAAQAMFDQARDAMKRGDYARACPRFAESQRLDPMPGTLANLAVCEDKRGTIASAWTHAREAIEQLGASDDRAPTLRAIVTRSEKRLPRLTIRLASASPNGSRVRRDDVDLGELSLGQALPVDPGEHTIVVSAPGRADSTQTITIAEGQTVQVEVTAGAESGPSGSPRADAGPAKHGDELPQPSPGNGRKTLGYVIGSVGVVGVGFAAVTGIVLLGKQSEMRAADCDKSSSVCRGPNASTGTTAASSGQSLLPVYYVGLAVGVVGIAMGAYLALSAGSSSVVVRVAPSGGVIEGRF